MPPTVAFAPVQPTDGDGRVGAALSHIGEATQPRSCPCHFEPGGRSAQLRCWQSGRADMARFDNKVVLVSGGARGQGAAEARLLVAQGAKVVIGDVLDNQGQSLAVELGPAASFVRLDVTSEADWARAVEAAQKLGGLHGLVNNAGIY